MQANIPEAPKPETHDHPSAKPPPAAKAEPADDFEMVFVVCVSVYV